MRVWDLIAPEDLCNKHLLGEHREIHTIWSVLTKKKGYFNHPEVKRWVGRRHFLYQRHQIVAKEMKRRGYNHRSPLSHKGPLATINGSPPPWDDQIATLKAKDCDCRV